MAQEKDSPTRFSVFRSNMALVPWLSILASLFLIGGLVLFALNAPKVSSDSDALLSATQSDDTSMGYPKYMNIFSVSWIATLAVAGATLVGLLLCAGFRTNQKLRKSGRKSMKSWPRPLYAFAKYTSGFFVIFAFLSTIWFVANIFLLSSWGAAVYNLREGTTIAAANYEYKEALQSKFNVTISTLAASLTKNGLDVIISMPVETPALAPTPARAPAPGNQTLAPTQPISIPEAVKPQVQPIPAPKVPKPANQTAEKAPVASEKTPSNSTSSLARKTAELSNTNSTSSSKIDLRSLYDFAPVTNISMTSPNSPSENGICGSQICLNLNYYPMLKSTTCLCTKDSIVNVGNLAKSLYDAMRWAFLGVLCLLIGGILTTARLSADHALINADQRWLKALRKRSGGSVSSSRSSPGRRDKSGYVSSPPMGYSSKHSMSAAYGQIQPSGSNVYSLDARGSGQPY